MLRALRLDEARSAFGELAAKARQDTVILSQYFNLARLVPASEDFHRAAAMIFAVKGGDAVADQLVHETFTTYLADAKPSVRLSSARDRAAVCPVCAQREPRFGTHGAAVGLTDPDHDELARALLAAAGSLHRHGDHESASSLARELRERRPDSSRRGWPQR